MEKTHENEKKIFLDVVKDGMVIPAMVEQETRVEDLLIRCGLAEYRLGFTPKGPLLRDGEKLFGRVHNGDTLTCLYYAD